MMLGEFEDLIGFKVDANFYHSVIEPMYTCSRLTKRGFVDILNKSKIRKLAGKQKGSIVSIGVATENNMFRVEYGILVSKVFIKDGNRFLYSVQRIPPEVKRDLQVARLLDFSEITPYCDIYALDEYGRGDIIKWLN